MRVTRTLAAFLAATTSSTSCGVAAFGQQGGSAVAPFVAAGRTMASSTTTGTVALSMVRSRGLEVREEGATPMPGGMTLYIKSGPDGPTSIGDCPFAHYIRTVLHEKGLEYDLRPTPSDAKPQWLLEHYDGQLPALRHRRECYVESDVVAQYVDFFFEEPRTLGGIPTKKAAAEAGESVEGLFPALARYLKHTPDGDAEDVELRGALEEALGRVEDHLNREERTGGPYLSGDGQEFSLVDAALGPKLYHMEAGLEAFKENAIDVPVKFPAVRAYMDAVFERPSFVEASYPKETIAWGWGNARES